MNAAIVLFLIGFVSSCATMSPPAERQDSSTASEEQCPDQVSYTGHYQNSFGFSLEIPAGLKAYWNSARCAKDPKDGCVCMGDHGRTIVIDRHTSIDAFAGYNTTLEASVSEALDSWLDIIKDDKTRTQFRVLHRSSLTVDGLAAERAVIEYTPEQSGEPVVEDIVLLLRSIISSNEGIPSHEYLLTLQTRRNEYDTVRPIFENVLHSWRRGPSDDDK